MASASARPGSEVLLLRWSEGRSISLQHQSISLQHQYQHPSILLGQLLGGSRDSRLVVMVQRMRSPSVVVMVMVMVQRLTVQ